MGYKRIPSAMHNFGHSFVSLMNYVDGEYVIDIFPKVLRDLPGQILTIRFPEGVFDPRRKYQSGLVRSVGFYSARFNEHLEQERVDPACVTNAELVFTLGRRGLRMGLQCDARATDDRGKTYAIAIRPA